MLKLQKELVFCISSLKFQTYASVEIRHCVDACIPILCFDKVLCIHKSRLRGQIYLLLKVYFRRRKDSAVKGSLPFAIYFVSLCHRYDCMVVVFLQKNTYLQSILCISYVESRCALRIKNT